MSGRPWLALVVLLATGATLAAPLPDTTRQALAAALAAGDQDAPRVEAELVLGGELAGDREAARATLAAAAQRGDARSAYGLGVLALRAGDVVTARARWHEAAAAGDLDAHYNLGLLAMRDDAQASTVDAEFEAAARGGHVLACYALGTRLASRDAAAARPWLECAARQGYAPAQFNLATLHARALHDASDLDSARRWYGAAAATFAPAASALAALPSSLPRTAPAARTAALRLRDHAWVLAQPGSAYTLQIASGSSAAVLEAMLARELQDGDAACVHEHPGARQAYSAIVGVYSDRASAEAARAALPASLRVNQPWVRRLASLQKSLRDADTASDSGAAAHAESN